MDLKGKCDGSKTESKKDPSDLPKLNAIPLFFVHVFLLSDHFLQWRLYWFSYSSMPLFPGLFPKRGIYLHTQK